MAETIATIRRSVIHYLPGSGIRLRFEFRLKGKQKIRDFCINVETHKGEPEKQIIRYDFADVGFHRDLYDYNERKIEHKVKIPAINLEDSAINGVDDLKTNLDGLLKKGGYRIKLPTSIKNDLEKEKQFLIYCIRNPDKILQLPVKQHKLQQIEGLKIETDLETHLE